MVGKNNKLQKLSALPRGAYIFDNDGVLVDTEYIWVETYARLLKPYGLIYDETDHRKIMGQSAHDCIKFLQALYDRLPPGEAGINKLLKERKVLFHTIRKEKGIRLMPGVKNFLNWDKKQKIPMAMATGTPRDDINIELKILGWEKFFGAVIAGDEIKRGKPAPDIYLEAARQLGVAPSKCVAFEDGISGLLSAKAAGMQTVFVRDPRFQIDPPFEPTLTIASFKDLL
jgi:HAD superfamily hydrolase (TIGR01509 family)